MNLSQWTINSDCSLTHVNDYTPSGGADYFGTGLVVSHNGKFLLIVSSDCGYVETYKINSDNSLTDVAPAYFNTFSQCSNGCFPAGIAITSNDAAIAIGNASLGQNISFVAKTSAAGKISGQAVISLTSSPQLTIPEVPIFSPLTKIGAADCTTTSKKCWLFMGMSGFGSSYPGGVDVVSFNLAKINGATVKSAKELTGSKDGTYGTIRKVGDWAVSAAAPGVLAAVPINYTKGTLGKEVDSPALNSPGVPNFETFIQKSGKRSK